jgi:hypothetical protein
MKEYTPQDLKRDIDNLKFQNSIQTIAVLVVFFFGISTIYDLHKKISK